ncbi:MAG: hypothetical protein JWO57_4529 [Pseudonocardiales bacterium]|nr:hypothetical protein [Pseudonocardiales bacterium]
MDELAMLQSGLREFGVRVHAIDPDQWGAPTPATEWSVTDLVGHVVDEHRWAPPLLHGHDLDAAAKIVEGVASTRHDVSMGSDLAAEWDDAATASVEAFGEPGALDRTVSLSRGPTPVRDYLGEMILDLTVHAWDLGKAIGYSEPLPEDLVRPVYQDVVEMGDLSSSGVFHAPVDVPDDAPVIDKLVAATGRDPR